MAQSSVALHPPVLTLSVLSGLASGLCLVCPPSCPSSGLADFPEAEDGGPASVLLVVEHKGLPSSSINLLGSALGG